MSETRIFPFDASEYLDNEETIAAYLTDALESGDENVMLAAFRDVAKARGMTKVAADAGVQRESLYKSLAEGAKPRFETILRLVNALGVKLVVAPEPAPVTLAPRVPKRPAQAKRAKPAHAAKKAPKVSKAPRSPKPVHA